MKLYALSYAFSIPFFLFYKLHFFLSFPSNCRAPVGWWMFHLVRSLLLFFFLFYKFHFSPPFPGNCGAPAGLTIAEVFEDISRGVNCQRRVAGCWRGEKRSVDHRWTSAPGWGTLTIVGGSEKLSRAWIK